MKLLKTTIKLGSGTLIAQGITFFSLPIISRIYSPTEYGQLTFLLSVTGLFVPIATLKIETLLVTTSAEEKLKDYLKLSLITSASISFFLSILFFGFLTLNNKNNESTIRSMSFFFCVILFVQALSVLIIQLSIRARNYKNIAQSSIVQNASTNILQILLGRIEPTASILVGSFFIGRLLGIIPMAGIPLAIFRETKPKIKKFAIFKSILKENKFLIPASFLEIGNTSVVIVIVSIFFGYQYSGFVGLTQSLLMVPVTLVAGTIGSIVLAEVSAINRDVTKQARDKILILRRLFKPISAMFAVYVLFFLFAANFMIDVVFSDAWNALKVLIPILSIPIGVNFFWNPFINLLYVEKRWVRILKINLMRFFIVLISSVFCIELNQSWTITTIVMFTSGAVVQLASMVASFKIIDGKGIRNS